MADEIEQMNKILSSPPGGTGDNMYEIAGAIDPREVGVEALNAGALSDEEFMMAEEFMNALPEEAKESFIDRLINDPKATIMSIMDTLGDAFGGGSGQIMDDLRDRGALSGINSGIIKGAMSDDEKGFAMSTALPQGLTDEEFQSFMDKKYAAQKRMKEQIPLDMGQPAVARFGK